MSDNSSRKTSWWPIIVGHAITITIFLFSQCETQRQLSQNDFNEFKRKVYERRAAAYGEIARSVAQLFLVAEDKEKFKKANLDFERVYWEKIPFIDDTAVERQMKLFRNDVNDYLFFEDESLDDLKRNGTTLLKTCEESLKQTWNQQEFE